MRPQSRFKKTVKNASRLKNILKLLVRHGFQDLVRKSHLADFLPSPWITEKTSVYNTPQRLRLCLEELGPTFIKLGQILSTRADVLPPEYLVELKKLQDDVPPVDFEKLQNTLREQYPQGLDKVFTWIDPRPIGSASIAQVHRGQLLTGEAVVLKIQKPGIQELLFEDIEVMRFIAEALDTYVAELKNFNLVALVEEFARTLSQETQFLLEANNTRRIYENFKSRDSVVIPKPYIELSGPKIFIMEYVQGISIKDYVKTATSDQKKTLVLRSLNAYFTMVLKDGLFHADLHMGNMLVVNGQQLALVDFGVVGRLSKRLQQGILNIFLAISQEDYEKMASEYIDLAAMFQAVDRDRMAEDLRCILSPYLGVGLPHANVARLMLETASVASRHHLVLPAELLLFLKSLVTLEGVAQSLDENFDWFSFVSEKASETQIPKDPLKAIADMALFTREITSLTRTLPMELRSYWRKKNHPAYVERVEINNLDLLVNAQIKSAKIIFFALLLSSLLISLTLLWINQST